MRHQRGFSIPELIISIVLLGSIAGIVLPFYNEGNLRNRRTEGVLGLQDLIRLQRSYFANYDMFARNLKEARFSGLGGWVSDKVFRGRYYRYATGWTDTEGKACVGYAFGNIDKDAFEDVLMFRLEAPPPAPPRRTPVGKTDKTTKVGPKRP